MTPIVNCMHKCNLFKSGIIWDVNNFIHTHWRQMLKLSYKKIGSSPLCHLWKVREATPRPPLREKLWENNITFQHLVLMYWNPFLLEGSIESYLLLGCNSCLLRMLKWRRNSRKGCFPKCRRLRTSFPSWMDLLKGLTKLVLKSARLTWSKLAYVTVNWVWLYKSTAHILSQSQVHSRLGDQACSCASCLWFRCLGVQQCTSSWTTQCREPRKHFILQDYPMIDL